MIRIDEQRRQRFKQFMEKHDLNPTKWGKMAGVPESTIRTYLSGKRTNSLNRRTETKLAEAVGTTVLGIYLEDYASPGIKEVWVKGIVGAGAKVTPWSPGFAEGEGYSRVPWPPGVPMTEDLIAYEIRGDSMPPYEDGDLVYLEQSEAFPGPEIINKVCVVETQSGELYIKKIRRGYKDGHYNLHSFDGRKPMEDAKVIRAARVRAVVLKQ